MYTVLRTGDIQRFRVDDIPLIADDIQRYALMIIKPIRIGELAHQGEWRRLLHGGSAKAERRCEAPSVPKADLHRKEYIPFCERMIYNAFALMIYRLSRMIYTAEP